MLMYSASGCNALQWRHDEPDGVSNHQPHDCLLNRLLRSRSKKTSKFRVTGICKGNLPVTDEFPAQMASNAEKVSIRWRHHVNNKRNVSIVSVSTTVGSKLDNALPANIYS